MLQAIRCDRLEDTLDATSAEHVLREFVGQEDGNSATIFVDDVSQVAHIVVFQSARMNHLFRAFAEVVLVEITHSTNANQYRLFSFAVTDFLGNIRVHTKLVTENSQGSY